MSDLKLYELKKGDIFTTLEELPSSNGIQLSLRKTFYVHIRKWYNPISWFKKYRCYQYEVVNKS